MSFTQIAVLLTGVWIILIAVPAILVVSTWSLVFGIAVTALIVLEYLLAHRTFGTPPRA